MLGFVELFKALKMLKVQRNNYYIKREIKFGVDKKYYLFCILPTIIVSPWFCRVGGEAIVEIQWLHMHITIGKWMRKEGK